MTEEYEYELHSGDAVAATGTLSLKEEPAVGERLRIGASEGIVRSVVPGVGDRRPRLIVQLLGR